METPITERSNPLSSNIDVASTDDLILILSQCDDEIFRGYEGSQGIFDKQVLENLENLSAITSNLLTNPTNNAIVLSGCGTSGRLAFMVATNFNRKLQLLGKTPCFHYLIAGNDEALFTSQEAIEDDPGSGKRDLEKEINGKDKVLYIGITCGLSAPYVGGQLEYSMENTSQITPVLMGFNPVNLARNLPVEKWNKTFRDIAMKLETLQANHTGFIINPIIGPEPITGSSRMKGGSATKILLDVLFTSAFAKTFHSELNILKQPCIEHLLYVYPIVKKHTYMAYENTSKVIEIAGRCLSEHGHLYYLSDLHCGVVGMIDSSECPPTYGSSLYDVRGFINGGYDSLQNKEGQLQKLFDISTDHFIKEIKPNLTENDCVIVLQQYSRLEDLLSSRAKIVTINITGLSKDDQDITTNMIGSKSAKTSADKENRLHEINVTLPKQELCNLSDEGLVQFSWPFFTEMSLKWLCNCISTGAHVIKGKVYENYMIDVKVSNNKLYHRAIGIVEKFGKCSLELARECLLKAVYEVDELPESVTKAPISSHIEMATPKTGVVPVAILLAQLQCSYQTALDVLQQNPVVRLALQCQQ